MWHENMFIDNIIFFLLISLITERHNDQGTLIYISIYQIYTYVFILHTQYINKERFN